MGRQVLTAITGATISSIIMAMVLPGSIALMAASESQHFYMRGFQTASLAVVGIMIAGAFHLGQIMDSRPYPDRFNGAKTPVSGT